MTEAATSEAVFDTEERRFLFELGLLGLTAGCKLEAYVFFTALRVLEDNAPYSLVGVALAEGELNRNETAAKILALPEVANSDLANYAMALHSFFLNANGESFAAREVIQTLDEESLPEGLKSFVQSLKTTL